MMGSPSREDLVRIYRQTRTIAVVGASTNEDKPAHQIPRYLQSQGYRIIPVNPQGGKILGERVYRSLGEIDVPVDVVDVFRPPAEAEAVARGAISIGAKVLWFQPGTSTEEAVRLASSAGVTVVAERCMGATHGELGLGPGPDATPEVTMALAPRFGIFLDPTVRDPREPFRLAQIADENGLDLLTIQDHPYQWRFYETWTLLTALAMATERIHVSPNVANLPLRLPAVLAKQAATLDVLTGGRVELGLGAGGFWDAIAAFGGPRRTPAEAYAAFEDALHILRGMWDNTDGRTFTYNGKIYAVKGAKPGPAPAHRIPIWVGARGPKMLRLTGRLADGLFLSLPYAPPETLPGIHALIDEGAHEAGRSPDAIRRGYNLSGVIRPGAGSVIFPAQRGVIDGTAGYWVDQIAHFYHKYRQDTFIFWGGGDVAQQIKIFAQEVIPAVKERIAPTGP
jgi:alkanesulfonate monooxygenase SsuD/methylene tetrahydromethanopterin reductase-like flavin-dependent oxidoreductase (luciferase family)/predicted CoA-binding protein